MKNRLTYKELTLVLGILVAAIIFIIIWSQPEGVEASDAGGNITPKSLVPAVKILAQKAKLFIQLLR